MSEATVSLAISAEALQVAIARTTQARTAMAALKSANVFDRVQFAQELSEEILGALEALLLGLVAPDAGGAAADGGGVTPGSGATTP